MSAAGWGMGGYFWVRDGIVRTPRRSGRHSCLCWFGRVLAHTRAYRNTEQERGREIIKVTSTEFSSISLHKKLETCHYPLNISGEAR